MYVTYGHCHVLMCHACAHIVGGALTLPPRVSLTAGMVHHVAPHSQVAAAHQADLAYPSLPPPVEGEQEQQCVECVGQQQQQLCTALRA